MRRLAMVVVAAAACGCGGGAELRIPGVPASGPRPVEEVLETAVEATQVATLALAALDGQGSCALVSSGCAEIGCTFEVTIDTGAGGSCAAPIALDGGTGFVVVIGTRTGQDDALLTANFAGLELSPNSPWFVEQIGSMVATRSLDRVSVVYSQQDVKIRSGAAAESVELKQHVWTANADLAGTPADTTDDTWTISGGIPDVSAGTGGAYVEQAVIANAEITPACRRNPSSGTALVERVGASDTIVLSMLSLGFHEDCDGRADVLSAMGTDMFSIGGTVSMDLAN